METCKGKNMKRVNSQYLITTNKILQKVLTTQLTTEGITARIRITAEIRLTVGGDYFPSITYKNELLKLHDLDMHRVHFKLGLVKKIAHFVSSVVSYHHFIPSILLFSIYILNVKTSIYIVSHPPLLAR